MVILMKSCTFVAITLFKTTKAYESDKIRMRI